MEKAPSTKPCRSDDETWIGRLKNTRLDSLDYANSIIAYSFGICNKKTCRRCRTAGASLCVDYANIFVFRDLIVR
jgi:hypothetical protein